MPPVGPHAAASSSSGPGNAFTFNLEDLPNVAVELIAEHASTSTTPAACLLPLVSQRWGTAAGRAKLTVHIKWDIAAATQAAAEPPPSALELLGNTHADHFWCAASAAAGAPPAPATAAPDASGGPKPFAAWNPKRSSSGGVQVRVRPSAPKAVSLASWLAKNSSRVRSLVIVGSTPPSPSSSVQPAWASSLATITAAFTEQQVAVPYSSPWPRLVTLDMPVLDLTLTSSFSQALEGCPALQRLNLRPAPTHNRGIVSSMTDEEVVQYVSPVMSPYMLPTDLRGVLRVDKPKVQPLRGSALSGLLRRLPPSLQHLSLEGWQCRDSIPVSCMTHLVSLREWYHPGVALVTDDISTSSGGGGGGGVSSSSSALDGGHSSEGGSQPTSSTSSSSGSGVSALSALAELRSPLRLKAGDARLQLPALRSVSLLSAEPGAWQQMQRINSLHTLILQLVSPKTLQEAVAGISGMTQVKALSIVNEVHPSLMSRTASWHTWAASIRPLTQLHSLCVPAGIVLQGGSNLLAPLTQLRVLIASCKRNDGSDVLNDGQSCVCIASKTAEAVVLAVAAAVKKGWRPLGGLGLKSIPQGRQQEVTAAASAALPGITVKCV